MRRELRTFEVYLLTEKRVALNTYKAYSADCLHYALYLEQHHIDFAHSTEEHLKNFLSHLHALGLSAKTLCRKIAALKLFFHYCSEKLGLENKAEFLIFPKTEFTLPEYCSEKEIQLLLETARTSNAPKADRSYLFLLLLYNTGMRVSELCTLGLSDIDWYAGAVRVMGKGGKMRIIPIPQPVIQALKKYIDAQKPLGYLFSVQYRGIIKPISRQSVYTAIKNIVRAAALRHGISPHALRHSLATHLLTRGWDLRSLQLLLGHEQVTTVQIYTHLDKSDLQEIYNKKHPRA